MTAVQLTFMDDRTENFTCTYTKTREGWLEIALTDKPPHERRFIPAHDLKNVITKDLGPNEESSNTKSFNRRDV